MQSSASQCLQQVQSSLPLPTPAHPHCLAPPPPNPTCAPQALAQKVHDKQYKDKEYVEEKLSRTYDVVFMSVNEPYRLVLSEVRDRLAHTK